MSANETQVWEYAIKTALDRLRSIAEHASADPECAHGDADETLTQFLRSIGYGEIVDAYNAITPKWYA